jgi:hypothetical protein
VALPEVTRKARLRLLSTALAAAFVFTLVACNGSDGRGSPTTHEDAAPASREAAAACPLPEGEDTAGGAVSFEHDVVPFFSVTCAFGGCHDGMSRLAGLYLGPNFTDGAADADTRAEVHASLLSRASTTPDLPRVTPGDPSRRFILLKLQGCQNDVGLTCKGSVPNQPCGARMPALSEPLPAEKRQLITRWIAAGARND